MATIETKERVPYRIWDKVNSKWNELRFKTSAKSVDADDGNTLETKIGAINGITSDLSGEAEDVAASIKCVNELNSSLGGLTFAQDAEGNWGYLPSGADAVIPFSSTLFTFVNYFKSQTQSQDMTTTLDRGVYMIHAYSSNVVSGTWSYTVSANKDVEYKTKIHSNGKVSTYGTGAHYVGLAMIYLDIKSDNTTIAISGKFSGTLSYAYSVYGVYKIG